MDLYPVDLRDPRDQAYQLLSQRIDQAAIGPGSLAALEVGTIGYFQDRKVVDLVSLTSTNPEFLSGEHLDVFFDLHPKIVVLHYPLWAMEHALFYDARFQALYQRQEIVSAAVSTQIYVRGVDEPAEIASILSSAGENQKLRSGPFTGFADATRCVLDTVNGRLVSREETILWDDSKDSLIFAGWMFNSAVAGQSPIELALVPSGSTNMWFGPTVAVERRDVAQAHGSDDYIMSGFRRSIERAALAPGRYALAAYQAASNAICDLHVDLQIDE